VVLGLQHLWRVGRAMRVGWWTGALAYVARVRGDDGDEGSEERELKRRAMIVGRAWREAHAGLVEAEDGEDEEDVEDDGFDIGDAALQKGQAWGGAAESEAWTGTKTGRDGRPLLPDKSRVRVRSCASGGNMERSKLEIPPCFIAEVEELPRDSHIEWSSVGVSGRVEQGRDGRSTAIKTTCAHKDGTLGYTEVWWEVMRTESDWYDKLRWLGKEGYDLFVEVYTSVGVPESLAKDIPGAMVVPCKSVWTVDGEEVNAVMKLWSLDKIAIVGE